MKIINATPHDIVLLDKSGVEQDTKTKTFSALTECVKVLKKIEPAGILPRVSMSNSPAGEIDGFPVEAVTYGHIDGLPAQKAGIAYVVSGLVAAASVAAGRSDCFAPGGLVRNKSNPSEVLGCLFLQKP